VFTLGRAGDGSLLVVANSNRFGAVGAASIHGG
jgi:hypothetical protein